MTTKKLDTLIRKLNFSIGESLEVVRKYYFENSHESIFSITHNEIEQLSNEIDISDPDFNKYSIERYIEIQTELLVVLREKNDLLEFNRIEKKFVSAHLLNVFEVLESALFREWTIEIDNIFSNTEISITDRRYQFEKVILVINFDHYDKFELFNSYFPYKLLKEKAFSVDRIYFNGEYFNSTPINKERLNWLGTPSQFGYIFYELAEKGFIEFPVTHSDRSYAKYAKICMELFHIKTTKLNLEKNLNPEKCDLGETNRKRITIPNIKDLQ